MDSLIIETIFCSSLIIINTSALRGMVILHGTYIYFCYILIINYNFTVWGKKIKMLLKLNSQGKVHLNMYSC